VRWADGVKELLKEPARIFLEVGPGRTLSGLIAQHPARGAEHIILPSLPHPKNDLQSDLEFLWTTVAQLWLEGLGINWTAVHNGERRRRIPLPAYPFERQHYQLKGTPGAQEFTASVHAGVPTPDPQIQMAASNGRHSFEQIPTGHLRPNLPIPYVAPRNELERAISGIWQDILGINAPGINDSFVALGGHSLLVLQLVARIHELFEIEIAIADLYQSPTIAGLAERIVSQLTESMDMEILEEIIDDIDAAFQKQEAS